MFKLKITAYFLVVIIMLLCGHLIFSQQQSVKSPEERAQKLTDVLTKKLELTTDQSNSIYGIFLSQAQQVDNLRTNKPASKEEFRQSVMDIRNQTDSLLQNILSQDQYQKFEELKQKIIDRMKNKKKQQQLG
jgi:hypothetical protein